MQRLEQGFLFYSCQGPHVVKNLSWLSTCNVGCVFVLYIQNCAFLTWCLVEAIHHSLHIMLKYRLCGFADLCFSLPVFSSQFLLQPLSERFISARVTAVPVDLYVIHIPNCGKLWQPEGFIWNCCVIVTHGVTAWRNNKREKQQERETASETYKENVLEHWDGNPVAVIINNIYYLYIIIII